MTKDQAINVASWIAVFLIIGGIFYLVHFLHSSAPQSTPKVIDTERIIPDTNVPEQNVQPNEDKG